MAKVKIFWRVAGVLSVCAAIAVAFSGCSKITILRVKEIRAMEDSLKTELAAMRAKMMDEQSKLLEEQRASSEMLRLLRADQVVRFNEIDRKVSVIESGLFESQSRLTKLDRQTAEVSRQIQQKIANDDDAVKQKSIQIEKLFEIAMSDFNAGRYDLAINGFADLARQYPESQPQASDSEFWVAECYFAKKEYASAEKSFFNFIKKYPDGPKSCASFYKLGLAYENQDKTKSRDMVWNNLLDRCPSNTEESQSVQARMKKQ